MGLAEGVTVRLSLDCGRTWTEARAALHHASHGPAATAALGHTRLQLTMRELEQRQR